MWSLETKSLLEVRVKALLNLSSMYSRWDKWSTYNVFSLFYMSACQFNVAQSESFKNCMEGQLYSRYCYKSVCDSWPLLAWCEISSNDTNSLYLPPANPFHLTTTLFRHSYQEHRPCLQMYQIAAQIYLTILYRDVLISPSLHRQPYPSPF